MLTWRPFFILRWHLCLRPHTHRPSHSHTRTHSHIPAFTHMHTHSYAKAHCLHSRTQSHTYRHIHSLTHTQHTYTHKSHTPTHTRAVHTTVELLLLLWYVSPCLPMIQRAAAVLNTSLLICVAQARFTLDASRVASPDASEGTLHHKQRVPCHCDVRH